MGVRAVAHFICKEFFKVWTKEKSVCPSNSFVHEDLLIFCLLVFLKPLWSDRARWANFVLSVCTNGLGQHGHTEVMQVPLS